jgi:hypothetical protein
MAGRTDTNTIWQEVKMNNPVTGTGKHLYELSEVSHGRNAAKIILTLKMLVG